MRVFEKYFLKITNQETFLEGSTNKLKNPSFFHCAYVGKKTEDSPPSGAHCGAQWLGLQNPPSLPCSSPQSISLFHSLLPSFLLIKRSLGNASTFEPHGRAATAFPRRPTEALGLLGLRNPPSPAVIPVSGYIWKPFFLSLGCSEISIWIEIFVLCSFGHMQED